MRIVLFSDIHGNREALEACLAHAERGGVDRFVFLGDFVGYGADPGWVIDAVLARVAQGAVAILGNHDAAVAGSTAGMNRAAAIAIEWTRTRLTTTQQDFLARLPLTFIEGDRLYVHASADAPAAWHYVTDTYSAARSLAATDARVTLCGHVHVPAVFHATAAGRVGGFRPADNIAMALARDRRWLAVIGAVGQPRDGDPRACYAVLDDEQDALTYIRLPYDIDRAAGKIREAGLPAVLSERLRHGY